VTEQDLGRKVLNNLGKALKSLCLEVLKSLEFVSMVTELVLELSLAQSSPERDLVLALGWACTGRHRLPLPSYKHKNESSRIETTPTRIHLALKHEHIHRPN
jgi:hypothetical protein